MKLNLLILVSILLYQNPSFASNTTPDNTTPDNTTSLPNISGLGLTSDQQSVPINPGDVVMHKTTATSKFSFENNLPFSLFTNANEVTIKGTDDQEIIITEETISKKQRDTLVAVGAFFKKEVSMGSFKKETDLSLKYNIIVPRSTKISITATQGNIFVNDLTNTVKLFSEGMVRANNISGDLTIFKSGKEPIFLSRCTGKKTIISISGCLIDDEND